MRMGTAPHQCMIGWATAEMHCGHGSRSLAHNTIHIPAYTSIHTAWHVHTMKVNTPTQGNATREMHELRQYGHQLCTT